MSERVYEPTRKLIEVFEQARAKLVCFVEAAEFERIEEQKTDAAIDDVRRQIREVYADGHEVALHWHPQWHNAKWESGQWLMNYSEYNLCTLPKERISQIVTRANHYLRDVVADPTFTPVSFRAGKWLFQPTRNAAKILAENGIKVDSSVFKQACSESTISITAHSAGFLRQTSRD